MKSRIAILFAVVAALVAASPASAVPAKPVDATAVTLLPADGTPDELRKLVVAFGKRITEVNSSTETKREQLQLQMKDGLEKAVAKAQASGDIDAVLALKAAKEKFETLTTSDVPLVKNAIDFREKKTAEFETARVADALKAAKEFNEELEKAKKDETTKGNFDTAKALSDYQKKLTAWAQSIRENAPAPQPARPVARPNAARFQPAPEQRPRQPLQEPARTVTVNSRSMNGTSIGMAKAGDTFRIQYVGGRWNCAFLAESPDADDIEQIYNRCCIILTRRPHKALTPIPGMTVQSPFLFTVPEDGEYALRAFDGTRSENFNDNSGSVRYNVQLLHNTMVPSE